MFVVMFFLDNRIVSCADTKIIYNKLKYKRSSDSYYRNYQGDYKHAIESLGRSQGARFSVKQLEKTKRNLEAKLKKLTENPKRDDVVTFEELGIDKMFVDEAHSFKNLFLYTKMRNVAGIQQTEAQKSADLYMKCQYLDEITGGKGIVFATGTPINTP